MDTIYQDQHAIDAGHINDALRSFGLRGAVSGNRNRHLRRYHWRPFAKQVDVPRLGPIAPAEMTAELERRLGPGVTWEITTNVAGEKVIRVTVPESTTPALVAGQD